MRKFIVAMVTIQNGGRVQNSMLFLSKQWGETTHPKLEKYFKFIGSKPLVLFKEPKNDILG